MNTISPLQPDTHAAGFSFGRRLRALIADMLRLPEILPDHFGHFG